MTEALRLHNVTYREVAGDLEIRGLVPQPWRSRLSDLAQGTEQRSSSE